MNLTKLFETQAALDEHIMQEHPELRGQNNLDWKLLALQVELGECANEWRGFKKWSKDQKPRTVKRIATDWDDEGTPTEWDVYQDVNPLLEEYVDCLHFILSIGLEDFTYIQFGDKFTGPVRLELTNDFGAIKYHSITTQFLYLSKQISNLADCILECEMVYASETFEQYKQTWQIFVGLGEMLGFTWDEVEDAYYAKNKVNHERQDAGY
ncbi:dUTP diphosphatase [Lysinibacillus fusiformis]